MSEPRNPESGAPAVSDWVLRAILGPSLKQMRERRCGTVLGHSDPDFWKLTDLEIADRMTRPAERTPLPQLIGR